MCYPRLLRFGRQGDNRLFPRYVRVVSDFRPLQLRVAAAMHDRKAGRSAVTYTIAEPCVDVMDKACIEECPVDCIYEGGRMLYIHPDECVDCGACEPVCPVEAIFYEERRPGPVERVHQHQRRLLRRSRLTGWSGQARQGRLRHAVHQGAASHG